MINYYKGYKQLVDKKFKEIVGSSAKENGFRFNNYTYYRVKNEMLQAFALKNCCVSYFEVSFSVSPTSLGLTDTTRGENISYFNKDNKYHISPIGSWEYLPDPENVISLMNEVKEIVEERLIPFFDSLTDDRALISFYNDITNELNKRYKNYGYFDYEALLNLYLRIEDYTEAEKMVKGDIESTITLLYNDIHGLSEHPYTRGGKGYLFHFKILTNEALMLKNLEERNYDYFREMIKENERVTAEFLSHPKFGRL